MFDNIEKDYGLTFRNSSPLPLTPPTMIRIPQITKLNIPKPPQLLIFQHFKSHLFPNHIILIHPSYLFIYDHIPT